MSKQVQGFHPASFLAEQTNRIRQATSGSKTLAAISGGVDSTITAILAKQALGDELVPVLIDTGFMRLDEPERVKRVLSDPPVNLRVKLVRASGRFLDAVKGASTAEEKRLKFRETFYRVLREEAEKGGCKFIVQGTIAPDWIETQGGIKTQHNVLEQVGIDPLATYGFKVLEPLSELYKDQVRSLGRHLNLSAELSGRQPFPGPGLLVRCIGPITKNKLQTLKSATQVTEDKLGPLKFDQYFAAVIENSFTTNPAYKTLRSTAADALGLPESEVHVDVFEHRVTGVKGDERCYAHLVGVRLQEETRESYGWLPDRLQKLQATIVEKFPEVTRVAMLVRERRRRSQLSVLIRSVSTRDFMTAAVSPVSWAMLKDISEAVLKDENTSRVYYDITPKPPATIEFE